MKKTILAVGLMAGLLMAGQAQATLIDRLNGLIYDDVNDISWTKDADISGLNNWDGQNTFAANFSLAGFDDFRLASIEELASLYGQLPGAPGSNKTGDIAPFEDIQSSYWSGSASDPFFAWAFLFDDGGLDLDDKFLSHYFWAVRPGDSVAAVPEVGSGLLMGLGLLGLRLARRWRGR